jgi:hypothetical protein
MQPLKGRLKGEVCGGAKKFAEKMFSDGGIPPGGWKLHLITRQFTARVELVPFPLSATCLAVPQTSS